MKELYLSIVLFLIANLCNAQIKGYVVTNESDTLSVEFPKDESYYKLTEGKFNQEIKYNYKNQVFHKKPSEIKAYSIELENRNIYSTRDDNNMFFVSRINASTSGNLKFILFPSYTYLGRKIIAIENDDRKIMIFEDFEDLKLQITSYVKNCKSAMDLVSNLTEKSTFEEILNDVAFVLLEYEKCN